MSMGRDQAGRRVTETCQPRQNGEIQIHQETLFQEDKVESDKGQNNTLYLLVSIAA